MGAAAPAHVDLWVAACLLAATELQLWLTGSVPYRLEAAVAGVALSVVVAARRRSPLLVVALACGIVVTQDASGARLTEEAFGALLALALVFYGAGRQLDRMRASLALALGAAGLAAHQWIAAEPVSSLPFSVLFVVGLPWATGRTLRARHAGERRYREHAERLDAEREQRTAGAALAERARIARELHDVIAHSVSVMVIQAGAARTIMDADVDQAESALRTVERAGHDALTEIRRLLGMIDAHDVALGLAPQPGLGDLADLVTRSQAAGLPIDLHVAGDAVPLRPALDLCAYRIVQEALTNAIKHAGPARASVRLRWGRDELELEVTDDGRGPSSGTYAGHGILGMRERAALHGGHVDAGAGSSGGFTVRAHLPLDLRLLR